MSAVWEFGIVEFNISFAKAKSTISILILFLIGLGVSYKRINWV